MLRLKAIDSFFQFTHSLLALMIMFGLFFLQVIFYFIGFSWNSSLTLVFFSILGLWTIGCFWRSGFDFRDLNKIDICFVSYVSLILLSFAFSGLTIRVDQRLLGFLAFMVITPYICGRCMNGIVDLQKLQKLILIVGLSIIPLLLIDKIIIGTTQIGRFVFFGMNHSPLVAGSLLATTMIALHSRALIMFASERVVQNSYKIVILGLLFITVVCLVWVSARGWLVAGLIGAITITIITRYVAPLKKIALLMAIFLTVVLSIKGLFWLDHNFGAVYKQAGDAVNNVNISAKKVESVNNNTPLAQVIPSYQQSIPILGEDICESFKQAVDSIQMRLILYREALTIFSNNPWFGTGAGTFGFYSCSGFGGFPHSTALQSLSELGILGLVIFAILMIFVTHKFITDLLQLNKHSKSNVICFFASLFVVALSADQIYGNFFMTPMSSLIIGIAAGMGKNRGLEDKAYA